MNPLIRQVSPALLDIIIDIEKVSYPHPWPLSVFIEELQHTWSHMWGYYPHGFKVPAGFLLFWSIYDELHILNLAVHPDFRRRGIAKNLLKALLEYGTGNGFKFITLEVRGTNTAAMNLYSGLNFKVEKVRKGYYSDNNEDALIMANHLKESCGTDRKKGGAG